MSPLQHLRKVPGPVLGLVVLLAAFVALLAARGQLDEFFSRSNLQVLFHRNSVPAVAALGMLVVILSGGIDLSVGSVVAFVTVVTMQTYRLVYNGPEATFPAWLAADLERRGLVWAGSASIWAASLTAVPVGVVAGTLCGLANGLIITRLKVSPFVATLGMLSVARGLAIWLAGRSRVGFSGPRPEWVNALAQVSHDWLFFAPGVWSAAVLAMALFVVLRWTVFGRYCYAIGSSEPTARYCGVDVDRQKVWVYTLAGLFAGWAGVLLFAYGNGGDPNAGVGLELEVIAAVVIGGASLAGGQGTVGGAMLGVLILGVLENGVTFFNVPVEAKYVLIGSIVVINTALSGWQRRREE